MRACWLIGAVVLAVPACGGVVRSSAGGEGGSATTTGGQTSPEGGRSPSAGTAGTSTPSAGTASVDGPACQAALRLPTVLACARELGVAPGPMAPDKVSVRNAEVLSELTGALEGGCLEPLFGQHPNGPELSAAAVSWTLSDGTRSWDVEVAVEGTQMPSLRGEKVSFDYVFEPGGFGPTRRELSVVSQSSVSHGVWIAEGGELPALAHLALVLSRGPVACSASESCGSYDRYDIGALDPRLMVSVDVPHGQTSRLGPWVIVHGGYAEQTSTSGQCADWFVADVQLAILGLM